MLIKKEYALFSSQWQSSEIFKQGSQMIRFVFYMTRKQHPYTQLHPFNSQTPVLKEIRLCSYSGALRNEVIHSGTLGREVVSCVGVMDDHSLCIKANTASHMLLSDTPNSSPSLNQEAGETGFLNHHFISVGEMQDSLGC